MAAHLRTSLVDIGLSAEIVETAAGMMLKKKYIFDADRFEPLLAEEEN